MDNIRYKFRIKFYVKVMSFASQSEITYNSKQLLVPGMGGLGGILYERGGDARRLA